MEETAEAINPLYIAKPRIFEIPTQAKISATLNLLKSKEESTSPHNKEHGKVEDALLSGHHNAPITTECVSPWKFLPFSRHLLSCYHHRHDCTFTEGRAAEEGSISTSATGMKTPSLAI